MQFAKGQVVVHPHHGPATVTRLAFRTVGEQRSRYLTLRIRRDDLEVSLPVERAEDIGVRSVLDAAGVQKVFKILAGPGQAFDKVWSRRVKDFTERLRSSDIFTVVGLVRDITRQNEEKKVSYGEMNLLNEARALVTAELAVALGLDDEEIAELIEPAVLEGTLPTLSKQVLARAS
ncbi:CarD family transcriptional regulator [Ruania zhangjianzhongii]|uniref:CarD family transcriptional regulator n=1 Tax=Ruania zhangjianzhongii TaxID=2603206 RepID=UPI00143D17B4|nr:CarD family transcriptional regulator [Ruania zhangjianzhongii]